MAGIQGELLDFRLMPVGAEGSRRKRSRRRPPVDEVTVRKLLGLYRECRLPLPEIAKRCSLSIATAQRIIRGYRNGTIDADGLKTAPLFPEVFRPGYASEQLSFRF